MGDTHSSVPRYLNHHALLSSNRKQEEVPIVRGCKGKQGLRAEGRTFTTPGELPWNAMEASFKNQDSPTYLETKYNRNF